MEEKYKIIMADDHVIFRKGMKRIIEEMPGCTIVGEASNGNELLLLLNEVSADMVLLDITMPGLRGIEATQEIVKSFPRIKVLILTMHKIKEYLYHALSSGASGYLLKEDSDIELVSAIQTIRNGEIYISKLLSGELVNDLAKNGPGSLKKVFNPLSKRECEIIKLIAEGKFNKEIAGILSISVRTVESHRANMMRKLDVSSTADLIKYALQKGIADFTI